MRATRARNINSNKKDLSPGQREELLRALRAHFEKNMNRHKGLEWAKVQAKLGETVGVIRQRIGSFPLLSPRPLLRCSLSPHPESKSHFRVELLFDVMWTKRRKCLSFNIEHAGKTDRHDSESGHDRCRRYQNRRSIDLKPTA